MLEQIIERGVIVVNVSQCLNGAVEQGKYKTSQQLLKIGVLGLADITIEAAITKLMYMLGKDTSQINKNSIAYGICGEISN